jgi:hypothetical protein
VIQSTLAECIVNPEFRVLQVFPKLGRLKLVEQQLLNLLQKEGVQFWLTRARHEFRFANGSTFRLVVLRDHLDMRRLQGLEYHMVQGRAPTAALRAELRARLRPYRGGPRGTGS